MGLKRSRRRVYTKTSSTRAATLRRSTGNPLCADVENIAPKRRRRREVEIKNSSGNTAAKSFSNKED
jgi:hypothetical protein